MHRNCRTLERFFTALNERDLATCGKLLDADVVVTDNAMESLSGVAPARQMFANLLRVDPSFHVELKDCIYRDGKVRARGRVRSDIAELAGPCLWETRVAKGRIRHYQSFRAGSNVSFVRMLTDEGGADQAHTL